MSFTIETKQKKKINVFPGQGKFISVYRKPTFSGIHTYFYSFLPDT